MYLLRRFLQLFVFLSLATIGFSQKIPSRDNLVEASPRLIRGPYLQVATSHSILIRWRTDGTTRSRVRYGTQESRLDAISEDSAWVTKHQVELRGLAPHTRYYYSIGSFDDILQGDSANYFFTLPTPEEDGVYRIGVFGDCGNNWKGRRVSKQLFNIYKNDLLKKYPLFPAPGNHEYHAESNLIRPRKPMMSPIIKTFRCLLTEKPAGSLRGRRRSIPTISGMFIFWRWIPTDWKKRNTGCPIQWDRRRNG
jgi:hypothetical protein